MRRKHPPDAVDLFENTESPSGVRILVNPPEVFGDDYILPPEARLRFRGDVASARSLSEASFENKKSPNNEEKPGLCDVPIDLDGRTRMLARFHDVYRFDTPVYDQPRDRTLSIIHHLRTNRSFEFAHLGAASAHSYQGPLVRGAKSEQGG